MISKVEVETLEDESKCRVVINGSEMENCEGLSFHYWNGNKMPLLTVDALGIPSFKGQADVRFNYSPDSYHDALEMIWDLFYDKDSKEYQRLYETAEDTLMDDEKAKSFLNTMMNIIARAI